MAKRPGDPPVLTIFRCDHLRPLVLLDDGWHHICQQTGRVLGVCIAGAYREPATLPENWGSLFDYKVLEETDR